jgi:hypothetical protein
MPAETHYLHFIPPIPRLREDRRGNPDCEAMLTLLVPGPALWHLLCPHAGLPNP